MGKLHGVDISGWDAGIDTAALTADFVIVKSTEGIQGTRYNPDYRSMADRAASSGKRIGFYHYANGGDPVAEADCFYESIREYRGRAAYALDWEGQGNRTFQTGRDVDWCKKFMDRIDERMGGKCLLYTSKGVCNQYDWSSCKDHPMWGAEYAYDDYVYPGYQANPWESSAAWGAWGRPCSIHQYGYVDPRPSNGGVGKLDADIMHDRAESWESWCGSKEPKAPREQPARRLVSLGDVAATIHYDMCVDKANGYAQYPVRWGGDSPLGTKSVHVAGKVYTYKRGSYDCSSSNIAAWALALKGTPYEGALDDATCTRDMRAVFLASGLFTWDQSPAKRGDLYLTENVHTAMCQDGGSDGVLGYDALSEFNRSENPNDRRTGEVGDQDGQESVVRAFYGHWDGVLHYNGKADFYVDADGSIDSTIGDDGMAMLIHPEGVDKIYYWDGSPETVPYHVSGAEQRALENTYKLLHPGSSIPFKLMPRADFDAILDMTKARKAWREEGIVKAIKDTVIAKGW